MLLETQEDTLLISIRGEAARAAAGDEEARGRRGKRQPVGSQELRVGKC